MTANPFSLSGRRILVVGATSGIGSACARAIAAHGGDLVITGRRGEVLAEVAGQARSLGAANVDVVVADVGTEHGRADLAGRGSVDGLVYAAGVVALKPVHLLTEDDVQHHLLVNYTAPVMLTRNLLRKRALRRGGSLVYVSSIMAMVSCAGNAAYSGSKGALSSFVRALAIEIAPMGMRANCVSPAMVNSGMSSYTAATISESAMDRHRAEYPLGFGEPDDVANAAVFLLSAGSRWMTGANMILDGGFLLR